MPDWEIKHLEDVVVLRRGFDLPHRERRPGPFPVLSSGVTAGWHDEGPVKGPGFVIGRATNLGVPTWTDTDYWPLNTTLYVSDFRGNEPRYVFHLFEILDLAGYDSGSVQPMLNRNYVAKIPVMVAPVQEQRAIAEVLGALDDKIAANSAAARTAEDLLGAEFAALRIDEEPVAQRATATVMDLLVLNPAVPKPVEAEPVYVDMQKLPVSGMSITDWSRRPARGGTRFRNGDTLLARITPCLENRKTGYVNFLNEGQIAIGSTEYIVMRSRPEFPAELSYFIAISERFRSFAIRHMSGTSGRQRVSATDLAGFQVTMPQMGRLEAFGRKCSRLFTLIKSQSDENRTLSQIRDVLLPQLMSGKLRVKDAEKTVEEVL